MLRLFVRRGGQQAKVSSEQLVSFFSTKGSDVKKSNWGESMEVDSEHPLEKVKKCLKTDAAIMKEAVWKILGQEDGTSKKVKGWDDPGGPLFPSHCDVLIIGGGAIGSSAAYWCKEMLRGSLNVVVVEKDPTYKQCSSVLSVGGLRQQFSLEENIEMSMFGAEFIHKANKYLGMEGEPRVDLQFHPNGYLSLATEKSADILRRNHELQKVIGAKNVLLTRSQLKTRFPWLTVDDIELGCLGIENEGWFDPWLLLSAFKRKAISLGAQYVKAEAVGFNIETMKNVIYEDPDCPEQPKRLGYLVVKTEDEKKRAIKFAKCIVAAGAFSGQVAKMAGIGIGPNVLQVPLPVEPRKRYVYCFHAPEGPGLNTPLTIDPTGTYFRREGAIHNYIGGCRPAEEEEPPVDNLEVDQDYFNDKVWPVLAKRIKAFENLKVKSSWAGYYDFNTVDENGVIGFHPYYDELIFATGFSGHGIQKAPAVGRAVSELVKDGAFRTIDLTRLGFDRFVESKAIKEANVY